MESIVYPYVNILEGTGNYFGHNMNDYMDVLYFIEDNALFSCKTFFPFCSFYYLQTLIIYLMQHQQLTKVCMRLSVVV